MPFTHREEYKDDEGAGKDINIFLVKCRNIGKANGLQLGLPKQNSAVYLFLQVFQFDLKF